MKIYTRTGDSGSTSLFSNERVVKNHPLIEAIGAVDEANSAIGLAIAFLPKETMFELIHKELELIQHALFEVGAALATPRNCHEKRKLDETRFDHEAIELLEEWMDAMDAQLPPLKFFILPGGHPCGAALHLCRSIVRRAERLVVPLYEKETVTQAVLVYLNRLSDYLFVVSRFVNALLNQSETKWQHHKKSEYEI